MKAAILVFHRSAPPILKQKFVSRLFSVMPVHTGIQEFLKSLDSGSPQPEADSPGMTFELCR
jgi:hypothetical protein